MSLAADSGYPAARAIAPRVEAYFATHRAGARAGLTLAAAPPARTIEALINAGFWASLRREEGYSPKISLAYLAPEHTQHPLRFEHPLALDPRPLARLAPAVERPGVHLGVWPDDGDRLYVWGTTRSLPTLCFVVEVVSPGLLVVKSPRGEPAKYVNVVVLQGDRIKVLDEGGARAPDCPAVVQSLLGFDAPGTWGETVNVYVQLAVSMRAHGRGGTLLVVPAGGAWRESIVQPIPYAVSPPYDDVAALMRMPHEERSRRWWQEAIGRAVDAVAGLTAVDGAAIVTADCELLAFGAKITRRDGNAQVEQVILTEPVEGGEPLIVHPSQFGGTRHLSAAQFAHDQHDAVALVASQDGRFTVFKWSPCEDLVHAHRVDALLL